MSELLVKKYGAKNLRDDFLKAYGTDLYELSDMDTEIVFVQGQMLGWGNRFNTKKVEVRPPENPLPTFDYGPYEPVGHLKNFIDECWGGYWKWSEQVRVGTSKLRVVNHFATRCFYDLVNRNKTGKQRAGYNMLIGPTSSGKTANAALYALAMMFVYRRSMAIKLVSTSATSAEDRVYGAAINLFEKSHYGQVPVVHKKGKLDGTFKVVQGSDRRILYLRAGDTLDEKGVVKTKMAKDLLTGIQLVPVQRGAEGQGAVRRLMGIKAKQKLLIIDEAGDCDPSIFREDMLINWAKADDGWSQVAYMWNPTWSSRRAVSFMEPEGGWTAEDYHPESPGWFTKRGGWVTCLNGLDTPNRRWRLFNDERRNPDEVVAPFPFLLSITDIEDAERKCPEGRESPAFMRMAVGFLCDESMSETVLTYRSVGENGADKLAQWTGEGSYYIMGCDPNLAGGDRFVICVGKIGYGLDGSGKKKVYLEIESFNYVPFIKKEHGSAEAGQVRYFQELCAELGVGPESVASDCTGASMSFVNAAEMAMDGKQFHRVHFAAAPSERSAGPGEKRTAAEKFADAKSEICFSVRDYLPYIRNLKNEDAIDQGCARTYEIRGRDRLLVEKKADFKERQGSSPDEFDALAILVDLAKTMGLGTEILSHPLAAQARLGRQHRITVKARYADAKSDERGGYARYGLKTPA
jgi:hypothetical protein